MKQKGLLEVFFINSEVIMLIVHSILFLCSGFGFWYGAKKYFKEHKALFAQLVTCAVGCFALSHLHAVICIFASGALPDGFHIGKLGYIGGIAFLFSASYGQMDGIADDKSKTNRKYRRTALIAPILVLLSYTPILLSDVGTVSKAVAGVQFAILAQTSYYLLKHILIPDVELGIIRSIRGYLICALVLVAAFSLSITAGLLGLLTLSLPSLLCLAAAYVAIIPILERGMRKWTV